MSNSPRSTPNSKPNGGGHHIEHPADILERELDNVIQDWLSRVEKTADLTSVPLTFEERTGHLLWRLRRRHSHDRTQDTRQPAE